jgi:hypothetical protein
MQNLETRGRREEGQVSWILLRIDDYQGSYLNE